MSLNNLKKRITSTQKTAQITRAMQMVAAAKYNRISKDARSYAVYAKKLRELVSDVVEVHIEDLITTGDQSTESGLIDFRDLLEQRPVKKTGFLVITSSQGLAGSYNNSVINEVEQIFKQYNKDEVVVLAMGTPIVEYCREEGYEVAYEMHTVSDRPDFIEVQSIVRKATELFHDRVFDALYVCYNRHINAIQHEFKNEQILPVMDLHDEREDSVEEGPLLDFIIEPSADGLLDVLLPQYAESQIYGAIIHAKAAEHGARMTTMQSATENAEEMIDELQQSYNQQRQLRVTNEIIEIVSGANAQNETKGGN